MLENGWEYMLSQELMEIRTPDAEKFLRELFTPILGKSTIHTLSLVSGIALLLDLHILAIARGCDRAQCGYNY